MLMGLFFIIKIHDLGERIMTNFDRTILHDSFFPQMNNRAKLQEFHI